MIGIIMGSDSDLPVMQDAINVLESFDIPFEVDIVSGTEHQKNCSITQKMHIYGV